MRAEQDTPDNGRAMEAVESYPSYDDICKQSLIIELHKVIEQSLKDYRARTLSFFIYPPSK